MEIHGNMAGPMILGLAFEPRSPHIAALSSFDGPNTVSRASPEREALLRWLRRSRSAEDSQGVSQDTPAVNPAATQSESGGPEDSSGPSG